MKINRTLQRSHDILEMISLSENGLTFNEILSQLKIPKSSAYDIITTLQVLGMVQEVNTFGIKRYKLDYKLFQLGNKFINDQDIVKIADTYLKEISEHTSKTTYLGTRSNESIVYLHQIGRASCRERV